MSGFSGEVRVYDMAVADVLRGMGIAFIDKAEGNGTIWHNFVTCPMCQKTQKTGGKCGVSNHRGVRCFRLGDTEQLSYKPFLELIGALQRSWTGISTSPAAAPMIVAVPGRPAGPRSLNVMWLERFESNLWRTPAALEYLRRRGLTDDTIRRFRIGFDPAKSSKGPARDFIKFPVWTAAGTLVGEYPCYAVPGLTTGIDVTDRPGWGAFSPITYYDGEPVGERRTVMVCEGMKDLWRVWQAIQGTELATDVVLMTSTHGTSVPKEWRVANFWSQFDTVYLAFDRDDAGDTMAGTVAKYVREADLIPRRLAPPPGILVGTSAKKAGKDWTDFFLAGHTVDELSALMQAAAPVAVAAATEPLPVMPTAGIARAKEGLQDWAPVEISGAYIDGKLYYAVSTLVGKQVTEAVAPQVGAEGAEGITQTYLALQRQTKVICSDRTEHSVQKMRAKKGTPDSDRVYFLQPAGIHVAGMPTINRFGRWRWSVIERWLQGSFPVRPLAEIVADVEAVFRKAFWLPHEEDYALLALTIPVTYALPIFQSVPLIFVNGPKGTGKSTIGHAMAEIAFNGMTIGKTTAAAVARHIHESRGLVALDDLEELASSRRATADGQLGDLLQALKVSYNQATAKKIWVDTKTMETKELNFFGVKVLTNTRGIDDILGSRCFRINTRAIPMGLRETLQLERQADHTKIAALRDELQAWAFDNVARIDRTYATVCPSRSDRAEEIAAPLRTIATLAGDESLLARLETAVERQAQLGTDPDDLDLVLKQSVKDLVLDGYREITCQHVSLQMGVRLGGPNAGREFTTQIPEWQRPDWIGRMLRSRELVTWVDDAPRKRLEWGSQVRIYKVSDAVLNEVIEENDGAVLEPIHTPVDFCRGCASCPYAVYGCSLQLARREWEQQRNERPALRVASRNN